VIKNYFTYYPFFRVWIRKYPTLQDVLLKLGMPTAVSLHTLRGNRTFSWSYHRLHLDEMRRRAFCLTVYSSEAVGKNYEYYQVSLARMMDSMSGFKEVGRAKYEGVRTWTEDIDRALGGGYHKVAPSDRVLEVLNP